MSCCGFGCAQVFIIFMLCMCGVVFLGYVTRQEFIEMYQGWASFMLGNFYRALLYLYGSW